MFNRRCWFEAHEAWEAAWRVAAPSDSQVLKGFIQAAVALLHLSRGNVPGALKVYGRARGYLLSRTEPLEGMDPARLASDLALIFDDADPQAALVQAEITVRSDTV